MMPSETRECRRPRTGRMHHELGRNTGGRLDRMEVRDFTPPREANAIRGAKPHSPGRGPEPDRDAFGAARPVESSIGAGPARPGEIMGTPRRDLGPARIECRDLAHRRKNTPAF